MDIFTLEMIYLHLFILLHYIILLLLLHYYYIILHLFIFAARICFAVDIWLCKSQNFICFMLIFFFFFLEEMG